MKNFSGCNLQPEKNWWAVIQMSNLMWIVDGFNDLWL